MSDLSGIIGNRYYIIDCIGHGGMTTVYKALDVKQEQEVAAKVLAPYLVADPIFKARFQREIKILKSFSHPNIVPIIDFGEHDGAPYLVMPFFSEGTLADRIQSAPISSNEIGVIISNISHALEFEHNRGIVHRDIKPSNILLDEKGRAYLSDFDLVYVQDASQNLTGSAVIGTPAYMSPEQCSSGPIDARSDQYSLAVVLYQLVTGHLPFYADTPIAIALQQINDPLPSPREFNPDIPEPIERVLLKALSKDPDKRYSSIVAFNHAFQKALRISIITLEATGSWTAKYYEITQVLNKIQSRARSWISQSVLTKRYTLLVALLLIFLAPGVIFGVLLAENKNSDSSLKATVAAIYTDIAQQGGSPPEGSYLQTAVASTLEAVNSEADIGAGPQSYLPVTGGEGVSTKDPTDEISPSEDGTVASTNQPGDESASTLFPTGTQIPTNTAIPTSTLGATSTQPGEQTPSPMSTPAVTLSETPTPTPSSTKTPTLTSTATTTPTSSPSSTPSATVTPSPTQNFCANVKLGSFSVRAVDVRYTLTNNSSVSITFTSVTLSWPTENQSLKAVQVGSRTIWSAGDDEPPTLVSGIGEMVDAGTSTQITFTFKRAAASSGYSILVNLSDGCVKTQ
jgi:serine/threonine protein kinase